MKRLMIPLAIPLLGPLAALAQEATTTVEPDSPFITALATWLPFLFLIALWWFFMRRMTGKGRDAYSNYIRALPERVERIEAHLADIAASLRRIAEAADANRQR